MEVSLNHFSRGTNAHMVHIGPLSLWFSYQTCVAFRGRDGYTWVRENSWGPTTGRHLNEIYRGGRDDNSTRLGGVEFEKRLAQAIEDSFTEEMT